MEDAVGPGATLRVNLYHRRLLKRGEHHDVQPQPVRYSLRASTHLTHFVRLIMTTPEAPGTDLQQPQPICISPGMCQPGTSILSVCRPLYSCL